MPRKKSKKTRTKNNNKTLETANRLHLGFIVVGIVLMLSTVFYRIGQERRLSFDTEGENLQSATNATTNPVKVRLPRYKVTLDIAQSTIVNGIWQINEAKANHLDASANPGEEGNIVLYGHNSNEVFGPLRWMSVGEEIEITSQDGTATRYKIDQIIETTPDDISWVLPKDKQTLTLYTCSGFLNSKRHIVVAYPINST